MPRHHETNPHFGPQSQDQPLRSPRHGATQPRHHDPPPVSRVSRLPQHRDQRSPPAGPLVTGPGPQDRQNQPLGSSVSQPQPQDQQNWPLGTGQRQPQPQDQQDWPLGTGQRQPRSSSRFSIPWRSASSRPSSPRAMEPQHQDQQSQPLSSAQQRTKKPKPKEPKRQDKRRPLGAWAMLPEHHDQEQDNLPSSQRTPRRKEGGVGLGQWAMLPEHHDQHLPRSGPQAPQPKEELPQQKDQLSQPLTPQVGQPPSQGQRRPPQGHEAFPPQRYGQHSRQHGLWVPSPRRTKPTTWFLAGFCAIFWIVIILGGLIVLIVYLLFRPHNPQFDVSGVTLNAAYLDMGVLLNADITVLANFTNPNRKVKVDFSYVVLDLYYGNTLIASQYVEPFSAARKEYKLQDVHLVTSQVRLPAGEIERLKKEVSSNAVVFKIKGVFRARSNLGSLLRYSYRLYGTCMVMVNGPPTGVIRGKRCKTKR